MSKQQDALLKLLDQERFAEALRFCQGKGLNDEIVKKAAAKQFQDATKTLDSDQIRGQRIV